MSSEWQGTEVGCTTARNLKSVSQHTGQSQNTSTWLHEMFWFPLNGMNCKCETPLYLDSSQSVWFLSCIRSSQKLACEVHKGQNQLELYRAQDLPFRLPMDLQEDQYHPTWLYPEMLRQAERNIFSVREQENHSFVHWVWTLFLTEE